MLMTERGDVKWGFGKVPEWWYQCHWSGDKLEFVWKAEAMRRPLMQSPRRRQHARWRYGGQVLATKRIVWMRLGKVHAQIIVAKLKEPRKEPRARHEASCSGHEPYTLYDTCRLALKVMKSERGQRRWMCSWSLLPVGPKKEPETPKDQSRRTHEASCITREQQTTTAQRTHAVSQRGRTQPPRVGGACALAHFWLSVFFAVKLNFVAWLLAILAV